MFVPDQYREPDSSWVVDLVRRNPLALLVTNGGAVDIPYATHLPIIFDPHTTPERPAGLPGVTLLGHMNRANPHWEALADGVMVLAIFTGAHAYVSPTVYAVNPAAPTWNFTSVHVRGVLHKVESTQQTLETVQHTVRNFEAQFGADWDMSSSVDYFRQILPGVGAFRLQVSGVQSMFKLSQEQQPQIRERVQRSFAGSPSSRHRDVAGLMQRLDQPDEAGHLPVR